MVEKKTVVDTRKFRDRVHFGWAKRLQYFLRLDIPPFDELLEIVTSITANRSTCSHLQSVFTHDARLVEPKIRSVDPRRSVTISQGIRGYISVLATLKFTYISKVKE